MKTKRISFISTVFNETSTIDKFMFSLFSQTKLPDEIIIVDAGSNDDTVAKIKNQSTIWRKRIKYKKIIFKLFVKNGNRSVGRNEAIKNATGDIIICSDSGNILDKKWLENITRPFQDTSIDVVAGYYKGLTKNVFQKCLVPYVLVMPDKADHDSFLPATRSMAFTKAIWKKAGGFDERFSHNEDYAFANKLKEIGAEIIFTKDAIVNWIPRKTLKQAFIMFFRFAYGDAESGLLRDKVILIFARYMFFLYLIIICILIRSPVILSLLTILLFGYIAWSIKKNYKYIEGKKALIILPLLQTLSDIAVLTGTSLGFIKILIHIDFKKIIKGNYIFITIISTYILTMLFVITSGIPGKNHPFTYQMDEWHQLQSVRNVFTHGSPNMPGSANGTMFNFFITGIMLVPFYLARIIDPLAIKSSVDSLLEQEKLFIILRLTTLFYGVLTLLTMHKIARALNLNRILIALLFVFTPAWLVLSNFFKYDIALTFWIVLSLYYFIKYSSSPISRNFLLACFISGVAFAVKVSGIPLLPIIFLAFVLFTPAYKKKYKLLLEGIFLYLITAIFLGLPDIIFGSKNMYEYLYENIVVSTLILGNYSLKDSLINLTILHKLPAIFGHVLYLLANISLFGVIVLSINYLKKKQIQEFKVLLFLLLSFILFCLSFIPLGITISANRSVVLLPFMVIFIAIMSSYLHNLLKSKPIVKSFILVGFALLFTIQIFESYLWIQMKKLPSPQQVSSDWVRKNIPANSGIGLENIPIYQFEPDFFLKEFYDKQYFPDIKTRYKYFVVDLHTKAFPQYVILSNVKFEKQYLKSSSKNDLVKRLLREGYKQTKYFPLTLKNYKYFDNAFYYPYIGLFPYPDGISIYKK